MDQDEQRAYSRGYAAGIKRVKALEAEIERLKSAPPKPADKAERGRSADPCRRMPPRHGSTHHFALR